MGAGQFAAFLGIMLVRRAGGAIVSDPAILPSTTPRLPFSLSFANLIFLHHESPFLLDLQHSNRFQSLKTIQTRNEGAPGQKYYIDVGCDF